MKARDLKLTELRPQILSARILPGMRAEEFFQNKTLRPIIKLQNDLLIAVFKNYIQKNKNRFYDINLEKRLAYIEHAIHKDIKFRNSLKGIILGQFTLEEYELYIQNSSALNKRMMNLVIQRIQDQVQLLEPNCVLN
ncbi:hypothetical protein [Aquimarina agarivorans]|uniref:hypothetical protein n=1 Tax=Aquimarina agarivorans TaxID=980584 RepID=UPI000248E7E2|nr:hypothetical protein [Aquimarina agarivorans]